MKITTPKVRLYVIGTMNMLKHQIDIGSNKNGIHTI